jgi:translation initiation factor IF-2
VVENEAVPARSPITASACPRKAARRAGSNPRFARADDDAAAGDRQSRSSRSGQGRRAGLGRSHCRRLEKLGTDEVKARDHAFGRRRHHRIRCQPGRGLERAIIGFNVRANKQARDAAERDGVEIRYYNIIYDLVDDVKAAMSGMLSPERRETFLGNAEILEVFNITKVGKVAGCRVTEGKVARWRRRPPDPRQRCHPRRQAQDAQALQGRSAEVNGGQECGMAFENYEDIRAGDVIECFRVERSSPTR